MPKVQVFNNQHTITIPSGLAKAYDLVQGTRVEFKAEGRDRILLLVKK